MAGDWLKIEANTPEKPEVFEVAMQLGIAPIEAFGRMFLVWRWFDQHTIDGNAPSVTPAYVDHIGGVTGLADAMKKVGWLLGGLDGLAGVSLPNFARHNGKTAKTRALGAKRGATHRERKSNDSVTQAALPREEKRRDKKTPLPPEGVEGWIPEDAWQAFEDSRKKLRKPLTPRARQLAVAELRRLRDEGNDPRAVIEEAVLKGWLSFYAPKTAKAADPFAGAK